MRKIISAIIVDKEYDKHDYSLVKTKNNDKLCEDNFDLLVVRDINDVLINLNKFDCSDAIITIGNIDISVLNESDISVRKKWTHIGNFDPEEISNIIIGNFILNIDRECTEKVFSIFTPTFNTRKSDLDRLYRSLLAQTYKNWNWYVVDDSQNDDVIKRIDEYNDYRITVIRNHTRHGNIGFNKHLAAMAADGDYLVEVDHDDELLPDCLEVLHKAFRYYSDCDFIYSDCLELMNDNTSVNYGNEWGFGWGGYRKEYINGYTYVVTNSPNVNAATIRGIYGMPNHVRCWKRDFYHKIGGHNTNLSILDDMDIIIRTFLNGKMLKINKALYIQHISEERTVEKNDKTAQVERFREIQRTNWLLKEAYDKKIHDRILSLGHNDPIWHDDEGCSYPYDKFDEERFNYVLDITQIRGVR